MGILTCVCLAHAAIHPSLWLIILCRFIHNCYAVMLVTGSSNHIGPNMAEGIDPEKQSDAASAQTTEPSLPASTASDVPRPTRGYAQLAEFMTKTHHGMMRRFKDLSTQNLLYLQAELYQLRFELDRETAADAQYPRTDERSNWDFHWRLLATSGQRPGIDDKRWRTWLKLRERLYEYREQYTHTHTRTSPHTNAPIHRDEY